MSDISVINLIIQRLEEERYTRQAEIRIISQHIQRLQQVRGTIASQVHQRFSRTSAYNRYQEPNKQGRNQGREEHYAPNFSNNQEDNQDQRNQEQANASDEDAIPDLEPVDINIKQAEQEFIEARGYLDENHQRTVHCRNANRPQRNRNRPQDFHEQQQERNARLVAAADDITRDILRGTHVDLRTLRSRIYNELYQRRTN
jgi:hypothetical protein